MKMTGKYEFKTVNLDNYELHYKKDNQEIVKPFKRTVELASKLQSVDADARFKMFEYLTKNVKSKQDLIVERKDENGKIIVDESNYREFEANFVLQAQYEMAKELYMTLFGMTLEEIIIELNLTEQEAYLFGGKVRELLINGVQDDKIPCKTEVESVSPTTGEKQ